MLHVIDPIVRLVRLSLIQDYLAEKKINCPLDRNKSPELLTLDIKESLENTKHTVHAEIMEDWGRILRMGQIDAFPLLHKYIKHNFIWSNTNTDASFCAFKDYRKEFKKAENELYHIDPSRIFLEKILNNKKLLGILLISISFFVNIAQIINDESDARYVALNIFHFILGALVCLCRKSDK